MEILKGLLFLVVYINALRQCGKFITKENKFFKNIIYGYILYYVIQFAFGFIFQLAGLPIRIYHLIFGAILALLNVVSVIDIPRSFSLKEVKDHFKTYWIVYIFSFVLLYLSVIYAPGHWLSNNLDDGYYVMKVVNFADCINVNIDPATGFEEHMFLKTWLARIVNTYELDLATYVYLFKMDVLIFINYFYTWFNYFFVLITMVEFFEKIFKKADKRVLTYGLVGVLFFAMYPKFFELLNFHMQDAWQFNTAIWYGSSICRIPAMFILFSALYEYKGQYIKQIIWFVCCSIVLMSKGTQILPILAFTGYLYCYLWLIDRDVNIIVKLLPLPVFAVVSIVLDKVVSYTEAVGVNVNSLYELNSKSIFAYVLLALFVVLTLLNYKNKKLLTWNCILTFFFVFSYFDVINDVLTTFSLYYFVAARATTLIVFTMVMTISYEVAYAFSKFKFGKNILVIGNLGAMVLFMAVCTFYIGRQALSYVKHNPKLTYNTVVALSEYLNELDEQKPEEELRVVLPGFAGEYGYTITPSTNVRYYANHITVVSLEFRYPCNDENNSVSLFTMDAFNDFSNLSNGDLSVFDRCNDIFEATDTNTIVLRSNSAGSLLVDQGYECVKEIIDYDGITDYYVYYKG